MSKTPIPEEAKSAFHMAANSKAGGDDEWLTWAMLEAGFAALVDSGFVVVPERREIICASCHLREQSGQPFDTEF
jgi:hypothetical protein